MKAHQLETFNNAEGIIVRERDEPHCGRPIFWFASALRRLIGATR